jgi:GcrA cell cycle regulator
MGWTDERVELLKKLWLEGHSASQIATQLGGVTRNAVIGKVHRLGLSGRATPSRPMKRPARPARAKPIMAKPVLVEPAPVSAPAAAAPPSLPVNAPTTPLRLADGQVVTVLTLKDTMCKWPIGDPAQPGFAFCGRAGAPGIPYCAEHARVAYQPASNKRKRDSDRAAERVAKMGG